MKKILLISGAALIAVSALAGVPGKAYSPNRPVQTNGVQRMKPAQQSRVNGLKGQLNFADYNTQNLLVKAQKFSLNNGAEAVTDEDDVTLTARYYTPPMNVLYGGPSPDGWPIPFIDGDQTTGPTAAYSIGLSGNKGVVPFYNLSTGADSYEWNYQTAGLGVETPVAQTSENEHLGVKIEGAYFQFSVPTLTAYKGSEQTTYEDPYVDGFAAAPSLDALGLYPSRYFQNFDPETQANYFGLTPCPVNDYAEGGSTYTLEYSIDKKPIADYADYYDVNGTCIYFPYALNQIYGAKYEISNVRMSELMCEIPMQTQPYLLNQAWIHLGYESSEDFTLTFTVCTIDSEGVIDRSHPLGSGEVVLTAAPEGTSDYVLCDLGAVDSEGFPTSDPIIVDGSSVIVFISGFDIDEVTWFVPFFNSGTQYTPQFEDQRGTDFFAPHSIVFLEFDAVEKNNPNAEPVQAMYFWDTYYIDGYSSNLDADGNPLPPYWVPTDFAIAYNIFFPYVESIDGTNMRVEVPAAGGDVQYLLDSPISISEMIQSGLMKGETDADWFTYSVGEGSINENGQDYIVDAVNIKADPLPEGETGRYAFIHFTGFASDFDLLVAQGEVAGISNVAAASGKVELYDLQGRKLNAVPAHGIYLERQGNKTVKRIAK